MFWWLLGLVWWLVSFILGWILFVILFVLKILFYLLLLILFLLFRHQGAILYQRHAPSRKRQLAYNPFDKVKSPSFYRIDFDDFYILTKDKVNIHCWLLRQANSRECPTIVTFHGNAGNIGYRLPNAYHMYMHLRANILMMDYRGYGNSEGVPTERGLVYDAEACLNHLLCRDDIDHSRIFLFGRSLGGAIAIDLAWRCCTREFYTVSKDDISINTRDSLRSSSYQSSSSHQPRIPSIREEDNPNANAPPRGHSPAVQRDENDMDETGPNDTDNTQQSSADMKSSVESSSFPSMLDDSDDEKQPLKQKTLTPEAPPNTSADIPNLTSDHDRNGGENGKKKLHICGVIVENTFTSILDMVLVILQQLTNSEEEEQEEELGMHMHSHSHSHSHSHGHGHGHMHGAAEMMGSMTMPPSVDDSMHALDPPNAQDAIGYQSHGSMPMRNGSHGSVGSGGRTWAHKCMYALTVILHYFISSPWLSIDKVSEISLPILFLSGLKDELVPPQHMKRLYQKAKHRGKSAMCLMQTYATGDHNATWQRGGQKYYDDLFAFLHSCMYELPMQQTRTVRTP